MSAPDVVRTIVAAIDGSADAARALRLATELAATLDAGLIVAHAAGGSDASSSGGDAHGQLDLHRELAEGWCGSVRDAGIDHHLAVVAGDPRDALLDVVRDHASDLLVVGSLGVGSLGRGPVRKLLLGSVARLPGATQRVPVTIAPPAR